VRVTQEHDIATDPDLRGVAPHLRPADPAAALLDPDDGLRAGSFFMLS
jgi:hypothetical protein